MYRYPAFEKGINSSKIFQLCDIKSAYDNVMVKIHNEKN